MGDWSRDLTHTPTGGRHLKGMVPTMTMARIDAFVFDGNPASVRLLEKLGFRYLGLSEDAPARHRGPVHHFVQDQPFDQ